MAIDTKSKRNAALKDTCGILMPNGTISDIEMQTLVGDYAPQSSTPVGIDVTGGVAITYLTLNSRPIG